MGSESNHCDERVITIDDDMRSFRKLFGARARELREAQHLEVKNAAALLGIDVSTLYSIERGRSGPSFGLMIDMAKVYKIDEAALFIWPETGHVRHLAWEQVRLANVDTLKNSMPTLEKLLTPTRKPLLMVAQDEKGPGGRSR